MRLATISTAGSLRSSKPKALRESSNVVVSAVMSSGENEPSCKSGRIGMIPAPKSKPRFFYTRLGIGLPQVARVVTTVSLYAGERLSFDCRRILGRFERMILSVLFMSCWSTDSLSADDCSVEYSSRFRRPPSIILCVASRWSATIAHALACAHHLARIIGSRVDPASPVHSLALSLANNDNSICSPNGLFHYR